VASTTIEPRFILSLAPHFLFTVKEQLWDSPRTEEYTEADAEAMKDVEKECTAWAIEKALQVQNQDPLCQKALGYVCRLRVIVDMDARRQGPWEGAEEEV
jgi:hypothetical protein